MCVLLIVKVIKENIKERMKHNVWFAIKTN